MKQQQRTFGLVITAFIFAAAWQASAKNPAAPMPGMKMDSMPKPGAVVERTPIDQLPEATLSGPTRMGKMVMPPGMGSGSG